jgi:hypothetical protein
MKLKPAMKAAWMLTFLGVRMAGAQAELPPVLEVAVPGGGKVRVALPPRMCSFPKEVRDRLARFLGEGEDSLRLLGVAGDCEAIDSLTREGTAVVSPSLQLAMQDTEIDFAKRSTSAAYRRLCFERFPLLKDSVVKDALRQSLKEADNKVTLGETVSLGLLVATREAVFGGLLAELSRAPHRLIQVQVVACFAPGDVPLLWTFQEVVDRDVGLDKLGERIRSVLALAQSQVKATMDLNRNR